MVSHSHYKVIEAAKEKSNHRYVILLHGLLRTSRSMQSLGRFLAKQGYTVYLYSYPSAQFNIQTHSHYFLEFLKNIISQHQHKQICIITHSLGGIIARDALTKIPITERKSITDLIMLSPPNQGSPLAKHIIQFFPWLAKFILPLPQLSIENEAYIHQIAVPKGINISIITAKYDAKTPPSVTRINHKHHYILVNSSHTFIMNSKKVKTSILDLLATNKI